ncbi:pentapeptide repeat-containing protein [Rothia mucilaginosa]
MPSNNASSAPESPVIPKSQEKPWYIRHFTKLLIGFGLGGGVVAILLPWMLWFFCGMSSGSSDQLRLHLLYVTGGVIAVLTLLQTNWKNQGDRLKIDADIKKNEQDAEKNERDHIRQVHTERRSRYTKAVEQLADEKAAVRLGGIYTLVGLVDEWLADNALGPEEQQKEGQVIINNLCSYIRSPFTLALKAEMLEGDSEPDNYEGDFSKDQAAFHEEQDVRRTVFVEMSKRSSTFTKNDKGEIIETVPGIWSDFDFDFSRAPIFYSLSSLMIEKGNFSSAKFYSNTAFIWATFTQTADFIWATFTQNAEFTGAKFTQNANFTGAKFTQTADFTGAKFTQTANFSGATFTQNAEFTGAKFTQNANFTGAKFTQNADFYVTAFTQNADFTWATFTQNTNFSKAAFTQNADFTWATFTQNANFSNTEFAGAAEFDNAKFTENATFRGAKFIGKTSFEEAYFEKYAPTFADDTGPTQFSAQVDPQDYLFKVHPESPHGFSCGNAKLLNRTFILPRGAILFNPDSWDEEKQEYTRISEPAK